ncbi:hypothetical protein C0J52_02459 [Blattella germanica]|nr:hypothetical protein C0J52_02459 [Blattella germanica]
MNRELQLSKTSICRNDNVTNQLETFVMQENFTAAQKLVNDGDKVSRIIISKYMSLNSSATSV